MDLAFGALEPLLAELLQTGIAVLHQHRVDQHVGIDNPFGVVVEADAVVGLERAAHAVESRCDPDFPPVGCGVLTHLVDAEEPLHRVVAACKVGPGERMRLPAQTVGMVRRGLHVVDAHHIVGRILNRLLVIGCPGHFERVVLLLEDRIFGMPAPVDIAVDLFARLEGDNHVVRLRIRGFPGFGMRRDADGGRQGQRTKEERFHTALFFYRFFFVCGTVVFEHQNRPAAVAALRPENLGGQCGVIGHVGGHRLAEAPLALTAGRPRVVELLLACLAQVVGRARTAQRAVLDQHLDASVRIDAVALLCEDPDADVRRLEVDPQPADPGCRDELLPVFGRRCMPADHRVNLLVLVDLFALVLVESAPQQLDVLCVFGEFDSVLFAAFDDASVLEIDAPLDGRGGVY